MKQTQWAVALCALAALVFGITFAMNYLSAPTGTAHDGRGDETGSSSELTFVAKFAPIPRVVNPDGTVSPEEAGRVLECEEKKFSYQDFWFRNDGDRPVQTGLDAKGCTCSSVGLAVLPDRARDQLLAGAVGWRGTGWQGPLALVVPIAATLQIVQGQASLKEMTNRVEHIEVAPGAMGFVRLGWTGKRAGRQGMEATLWMGEKERQPVPLSARVLFQEAMAASPRSIDELGLTDEDLAKGKEIEVLCWSGTRLHFRVTARLVHPPGSKPASDPVTVGEPVPLRGEELEKLEAQYTVPQGLGQVLSAYRVVVTLRGVSADRSTRFDLGRFRRQLVLASEDEGINPITIPIRGRVRGLVELGTDGEMLSFGTFRRGRGSKRDVTLFSSAPGLQLAFDRVRTPKWLAARLSKPSSGAGGRQSWTMTAEVLPGDVGPDGQFPTPESGPFHDAAIYLHATLPEDGKTLPRTVRIEVQGTAAGN